MRRALLAAIAGAGMIVSAGVHAQDLWSGPEAGIQGGYGWGSSSGHFGGTGAGTPGYSFSPDGALGGGHAGYNWQMGPLVLGLEGDVEGGDIGGRERNAVGGYGVGSSMDFDASVRGKLGYAFNRLLLYGTGGVEFGDVVTHYHVPLGGPTAGGMTDMRAGWTAGAGVGYGLTPNWEADLEYRYADLGHDNFALINNAAGATSHNEFNYNMIRVGLTYRFAPPPPAPPPVAAPVAAPAPPPPPMERTFLVFFDFDKYNLTSDARRVIEAAAANYKATGSARIDVSGYTDLSGTQAYNMRLSRRRADAVAAYLMHLGVPKNVMDVKWFGKEHPRVPTADGVREPQNRRVEIVMQ